METLFRREQSLNEHDLRRYADHLTARVHLVRNPFQKVELRRRICIAAGDLFEQAPCFRWISPTADSGRDQVRPSSRRFDMSLASSLTEQPMHRHKVTRAVNSEEAAPGERNHRLGLRRISIR
jgi:hypothetical protein